LDAFGITSNAKVVGPLVFVGFGITAAEQNYDDYNGMMKGAIALALPAHLTATIRTANSKGTKTFAGRRLQRGMRAQRHS